jgi:hypothetical protein
MCTQEYVYLLIFPISVFYKRDVKDTIYPGRVSPNLSHWVIGVFHSILRMETFIFSIGFLKDYMSTLLIFSIGLLDEF